ELAGAHDTDAERHAARQRMLDHYLHAAHAANLLLQPYWDPITITAPAPGVVAEELADHTAALAWFDAEYAVLLAAGRLAARDRAPPRLAAAQNAERVLLPPGALCRLGRHRAHRPARRATPRRPARAGPRPPRSRPRPGLARTLRRGTRPPPAGR